MQKSPSVLVFFYKLMSYSKNDVMSTVKRSQQMTVRLFSQNHNQILPFFLKKNCGCHYL